MIAVIADQVKAFRHQLNKHLFFVGSRAVLQPYEVTVQEMLERMALEWAGERVAEWPPEHRASAALRAFAQAHPDGRERVAALSALTADLRAGEGHIQLARLIKDGYVPLLFTMSPDDSLERALAAQRLTAGEDYHCVVAGADSPEAIDVAVRESTRVVVVKCGGDIGRKVLPLTPEEIGAVADSVSNLIRWVFRRTVIFTAYGERDKPFLERVPRDGDKIYWVNLHIPVEDRDALDGMRLESPDAEQFHKLQPEVLELLRARNSERNLLCREAGRFSEFFGRLYERLRRRALHHRVTVRRGLTVRRGGPYKFLESFDVHDADFFFGREQEVAQLYELLNEHPLVTMFGQLGVGKTSLLRAGLIPKLRQVSRDADKEDQLPWLPVYIGPGFRSAAEVTQALAAQVEEAGYDASTVSNATQLSEAVHQCWQITNHRPVLLLDSVHELFLKLSQAARDELLEQIAHVVADEATMARAVLTIREDYLGELYDATTTLPQVFHHMLRLRKFTRQQAEDAIVKPAASFGLQFDQDLVVQMLEDLDRGGILPAHLEIVCHRLLEEAGPTRRYIGPLLYNRLGGAKRILDDYLTRPLAQLSIGDRRLAWQIMRTLAEASETLASLPTDEVMEAVKATRTAFERVVARLEDMRFVRTFERSGERHVELIHDLLAEDVRTALAKGQPPTAHAAHDILARGLDNMSFTGRLLDRGEMHRVDDERDELTLSVPELELAIRSAVEEDIDPDYWLGRLGELRERKYAVLSDMVESDNKRIRTLALKHAQQHLSPALIRPLTKLAQAEGEDRAEATELLKSMKADLLAALSSDDSEQRSWAARAIAHIGARHLRELAEALDDQHPDATDAIAEALARVDPQRASRMLVRSLLGTRPQWAAAEALGRLGQSRATLALLQRATSKAPASAHLAYAFGLALMRQRRYEEAAEVLDTAIRLAQAQGLNAERIEAALQHCHLALLRSHRGEDRWPVAGGSLAHTHYVAHTLWPPLNEFWATELESEVAGHVIAAKGLIFAALRNGTAVALDASSGAMVWKRSLGARVETSPALSGDSLLVATVDAQLIGISLAGDQRFALRLPSPARAALTATEHTVFIGDRSGAFVTVDLGTLQPALRHQFGDEITAAVSLAHGLAFVASWEASVAAFDTTTWQTRWIWRGDSPIASALAVAEDVAIWTCDQGEVVCANPLTGELIWQVKLPAGSRAAPAVSPDHVLVASLDGAIRALRRSDGKQLWEFPTADQVLCAPLVTGEIVYISSRDGSLYALSLADGEQRWRYATSYGVYATVAVVEGALVVPLRQRHVVAFVPGEEAV